MKGPILPGNRRPKKERKPREPRKLLTGQRFGMLLVIQEIEKAFTGSRYRVIVLCDCGNVAQMDKYKLVNRGVKSCGCQLAVARKRYAAKQIQIRNTVGIDGLQLQADKCRLMRLKLPGGISKVKRGGKWR